MKTFARIDGNLSFRHCLWHMLFGVGSIIDGLVSVLSLGIVSSLVSVKMIYAGWARKLYDHEEVDTVMDQLSRVVNGSGPEGGELSEDEIKEMVSKELGIPVSHIEILGSPTKQKTPDGVLVMPKKGDERWH